MVIIVLINFLIYYSMIEEKYFNLLKKKEDCLGVLMLNYGID